jgi:hypothetical protein
LVAVRVEVRCFPPNDAAFSGFVEDLVLGAAAADLAAAESVLRGRYPNARLIAHGPAETGDAMVVNAYRDGRSVPKSPRAR